MKAVFFDFDGVILDSVNIKTEAFSDLFVDYGEDVQQKVVEYHLLHGGVSRYEKFKYYYNKLLEKEISSSELEELSEKFSELTMKKILATSFIDGAYETLEALKQHDLLTFIASGTPQDDLDVIVTKRGLRSFFHKVCGSPKTKEEIVGEICNDYSLSPQDCIFVGDALTDLNAASWHKMPFLGVVKDNKQSHFPISTIIAEKLSYSLLKDAFLQERTLCV